MNNLYSCSRINEYLKCPFSYKGRYILKLPCKFPDSAMIGIKVHKIIELVINEYKRKKEVDINEIINSQFQNNRSSFQTYIHCNNILKLFDINKFSINKLYQTELKIKFFLDKFLINGRIDRLDRNGNEIHIIDYKTGKPWDEFGLQEKIYSIGIKNYFNSCTSIKVSKYFVGHNKVISYDVDMNELDVWKTELIRDINKIENEKEFLPKKNWSCKNCCYKKTCGIT